MEVQRPEPSEHVGAGRFACRDEEVLVRVALVEGAVLGAGETERVDGVARRLELGFVQVPGVRDQVPLDGNDAVAEDRLLRGDPVGRREHVELAVVQPVAAQNGRAVMPLLRADVHVELAVLTGDGLRRRAVLHAHDQRPLALRRLHEAVLPREPAELGNGEELVVGDGDGQAALPVERVRRRSLFLVREVDPAVEAMLRAGERARAEPREGARRVSDLGCGADERVLVVDPVVRALGGDHLRVAVEDDLRDERAAVERATDVRLRLRRARQLVVHEDRRSLPALVGAEPVRESRPSGTASTCGSSRVPGRPPRATPSSRSRPRSPRRTAWSRSSRAPHRPPRARRPWPRGPPFSFSACSSPSDLWTCRRHRFSPAGPLWSSGW